MTVGSKKNCIFQALWLLLDCTQTSIYSIKEILVPENFHKEHPATCPHKDALFQLFLYHMLVGQPHRDSQSLILSSIEASVNFYKCTHLLSSSVSSLVYLNILISATFFDMFFIRLCDPPKVLYVHIYSSQRHFAVSII